MKLEQKQDDFNRRGLKKLDKQIEHFEGLRLWSYLDEAYKRVVHVEKVNGRLGYLEAKIDIQLQVAHVVAELGEIYQAEKHREAPKRVLEEISDAWMAILGLLYACGFEPIDLLNHNDKKLRKLVKTGLVSAKEKVSL